MEFAGPASMDSVCEHVGTRNMLPSSLDVTLAMLLHTGSTWKAMCLGILSSQAEIGLGFHLILYLFSWQRNMIQTFMYWQACFASFFSFKLLKLMYHAPVTAGYHQSVWANMGRTVDLLVNRYAPFLNTPISAVKRWWLRQ